MRSGHSGRNDAPPVPVDCRATEAPGVICPYCGHNDDKVIDSRASEAGKVILEIDFSSFLPYQCRK